MSLVIRLNSKDAMPESLPKNSTQMDYALTACSERVLASSVAYAAGESQDELLVRLPGAAQGLPPDSVRSCSRRATLTFDLSARLAKRTGR